MSPGAIRLQTSSKCSLFCTEPLYEGSERWAGPGFSSRAPGRRRGLSQRMSEEGGMALDGMSGGFLGCDASFV